MERIYHKKSSKGIGFLSIILLFIGLNQLSAQTETKINEIKCYNLGDGRYYCHYIKGEKPLQGKMRIIDGYSTQYIDAVFNKGIPHGSWKTYRYNKLISEYIYQEGVFHGENKEFYPDGTVKSVSPYVNGKPEGKFITYGSDGKVESEAHYKNGLQDGTEIRYADDGSVRFEATYSQGKEIGLKRQRYSEYELTAHYKDGKYHGAYSEIYTNGNVKISGSYIDGKKDGTWETGKKDGVKVRTEVYADDDKIKETIYYTDGRCRLSAS